MSPIRPLERQDIPQVASLFEFVMGSGSRTPRPGLDRYFERVLLDHPWADPEIPSLLYVTADEKIAGFIGSHVRRLRIDGEHVRAGYTGQFMSDPVVRKKGIGALLLRRYLAGPQDVTITDSADPKIRPLWERLGGTTVALGSLTWLRFFRPFRFGGDYLFEHGGNRRWKPLVSPVGSFFDAVAKRVCGSFLNVNEPPTKAESLTPRALLEHLPSVAGRRRVCPNYDEKFLAWLFREMDSATRAGTFVRQLVRDQSGRTLGWYVAYLYPHGMSEVQQVAATRGDIAAVIDHLFHHAQQCGASVLRGRLEPLLLEPVWERHCYIRHGSRFLIHSRNPSLVNAVATGDGLLTSMDGEYWMKFPLMAMAR